jgi:hypothetical protein
MPRESDEALLKRIEARVIPLVSDYGGIPRGSWKPVYAWDLDSTIASTVHRRHMVDAIRAGGGITWDDYAMKCADDVPIAGSVALMRELRGGCHVIISGRSGQAEELTWTWLEQHDVPADAALLRIHGDHTPNGIYKIRVLNALKALGAEVRLYFEDWREVATQIEKETGIPVVGINPFDPDELGERQGAI